MSAFCLDCGTEVATQYRFCPSCGGRRLQMSGQPPSRPNLAPVAAPPYASSGFASSQPPAVPVGTTTMYAGFWRRVAAYLIDTGIFFALFVAIAVVLLLATSGTDLDRFDKPLNLLSFILGWLYFAQMESGPHQATIGKRAMGLRVCDLNGQRLSFANASGRYFGKILSALLLCIGFAMVAFTQRKQALHDIMASTLVLRVRE